MEIVFQKQVGRGRPAKMAKLDDGTLIRYRDYVAQQKAQKAEAKKDEVDVTTAGGSVGG